MRILVPIFVVLWSLSGFAFQIRPGQPVVVEGSELAQLSGASVADLVLQTWDGSQWQTVPFQIDERDASGSYFLPDDTLLDANDQLVFQPQDAGIMATVFQWPNDLEARSNPRIQIEVEDSVLSGTGFVYLFQSSTLPAPVDANQVTYDQPNDIITGLTYQVGFNGNGSTLTDLQFRSGATLSDDVLDREKIRISGTAIIAPFELNEDNLTVINLQVKAGPVRIIRQLDAEISVLTFTVPVALIRHFYRRYFEIPPATGTITLPGGVSLQAIRFSRDFNAMATNATVSDPNNNAILVDGNPDAGLSLTISAQQAQAYYSLFQFQSFQLWNLMSFPNIAPTIELYYRDNTNGGTADGTADTGDLQSFGDHGVLFRNPNPSAITLSFGTLLIEGPALDPTNITAFIQQPLEIKTAANSYADNFWIWVSLWGTDNPNATDILPLVDFISEFGSAPSP